MLHLAYVPQGVLGPMRLRRDHSPGSMLAGSLYVLCQYLIDLGVDLPSIIPA